MSTGDGVRVPRRPCQGFTLVELLVAIAVASLLLAALNGIVGPALASWSATHERNELTEEARFAMERMVHAVARSRLLVLPLAENPATATSESVRDLLAVTLDPEIDRDGDGFADADNDHDGQVDEDSNRDANNDLAPGIWGVDDDGDGLVDEGGTIGDDDEDGVAREDWVNGLDDDGDGSIDEDRRADANNDGAPGVAGVDDDGDGFVDEGVVFDDDEDGLAEEDWLDTVVYRLAGTTLWERLPEPNGIDGRAFTERPIAEGVTQLQVTRLPPVPGQRSILVEILLELSLANGETVSVRTRVRMGAAL